MKGDFDLAIVGSGFGGTLTAMIARRLGLSVILLEKGRHPRFAIGESTTPLTNLYLEELARRYDLPRLLPLCKWGTWRQAYPDVGCGLKRGFTFYHHAFDRPPASDPDRRRQLLVAASPHDGVADTHWYRPDFDHFLLREAQAMGAEYLDEVSLSGFAPSHGGGTLTGERRGRRISMRARLTLDATGPRGFLHRALGLSEAPFEYLPATQGLYTHFTGVGTLGKPDAGGEAPPYAPDDAALHHVFDGGWIWVLRFNNGLTSAGVAARDSLAQELGFRDGEAAWHRLLKKLPAVREQFAQARPAFDFMHAPRMPFRSADVAGTNWALLPSAAGFVDPLLSTGFPLTLRGIARLAGVLESGPGSEGMEQRLRSYAAETSEELSATECLVGTLYATLHDFEMFTALSLLYFSAVSFSETARRLGKPELADSFLLHKHPAFGPQTRACLERARRKNPDAADREALLADIRRTLEPFNVAGFGDPGRRNWYPVDAGDLFRAAPKLGAGEAEIEGLLQRCGFIAQPHGGGVGVRF